MVDLGITRHQYNHRIALLRSIGFIDTMNAALLGFKVQNRTTAFRVTEEAYAAIDKVVSGKPHRVDNSAPLSGKPDDRSPENRTTTQDTPYYYNSNYNSLAASAAETQEKLPENVQEEVGQLEDEKPKVPSMENVIAWKGAHKPGAGKKMTVTAKAGRVTVDQLEAAYARIMKDRDETYFHRSWGRGQLAGQVKNMIDGLQRDAILNGVMVDVHATVVACLKEWGRFQAYVLESTGKMVPDVPSMPHLTIHSGWAVMFAKKELDWAKQGTLF